MITAPVMPTTHYFPYILKPQDGIIKALLRGKQILLVKGGEYSRLVGIGLDQDTRLRGLSV